jgi:ribonuclease BN (tRNA processing enzyme)
MPGLNVLPLGVGDAFSALHYSSCVLLECDGQHILIDCPHPIRKILHEAGFGIDVPDIHAVVLTHLHADHSSGVEGFGYYAYFTLGRRAHLVAHPAVSERLWPAHLAAGMEQIVERPGEAPHHMGFDDYFALTPLDLAAPVHPVPTTALRISAAGRTLGYSADTAFDPALIDWLSACDLIIHETQGCYDEGIHTPYERLADLPMALRDRIRLIHYPDDFDPATSSIPVLRQGERIEV